MGADAAPAGAAKPVEGGRCPRCHNGVLYRTAENDAGVALHCFNCVTTGTIPHEGDYSHVVTLDDGTSPTGFQLTGDQLAAKREAGIDPHVFAPWPSQQQPAPADEPVETHDVAPQPDEPGEQ